MKKFIIMGLTLFAFALVGCKKDSADDSGTTDGNAGDGETPAVVYTITNTIAAAVTVSSGDASVSVDQNKCVSVKADQWAALKVDGVCDNSNTAAADATAEAKKAVKDDDCPAAGNYNVAAKSDGTGNELTADAEAGTECAELKKAEEATTGATTDGSTTGGDTTGGDTTGGDTTGGASTAQ